MNQVVAHQPHVIDLAEERPAQNAVAAIEQGRAMQEATASILAAKRFPRDEVQAYNKIMNACTRKGLAEVATYEYSRGGSKVTGPSIRLAEALKQYWGNIDSGWRELERQGNKSLVQAFAWDKETNTRATRDFTVMQVRDKWIERKGPDGKVMKGSDGKVLKVKVQEPLSDERDIYENCANNAARRMRACILELIPGDIIDAAVEACAVTLASKEPNTPETRAAMLKVFFDNHGVNQKMIEKYIGRSMDAIVGGQIVKLRSIYNSLQDEMSKTGDWFDLDLAEKKEEPKAEPEKKPATEATKTASDRTTGKNLDAFKEQQKANDADKLKGASENDK